jgi:hypothetical protein
MLEKIQEFDFEIEYMAPEEMIVADSLSRIYTKEEEDKKRVNLSRRNKQIEGKRNKHVKKVDGEEYWVFYNGRKDKMPPEQERDKLILDSHRGKTAVHYELRTKLKKFFKIVRNVKYITERLVEEVITMRYLEKVRLDMIEFREEKVFVAVAVDYFTRRLWGEVSTHMVLLNY